MPKTFKKPYAYTKKASEIEIAAALLGLIGIVISIILGVFGNIVSDWINQSLNFWTIIALIAGSIVSLFVIVLLLMRLRRGLTYSELLEAWEKGEISAMDVLEAQQWFSWQKWQREGNETGWLELREMSLYDEGLLPRIQTAIEMEIRRMEEESKKGLSKENESYIVKLKTLLKHPNT